MDFLLQNIFAILKKNQDDVSLGKSYVWPIEGPSSSNLLETRLFLVSSLGSLKVRWITEILRWPVEDGQKASKVSAEATPEEKE